MRRTSPERAGSPAEERHGCYFNILLELQAIRHEMSVHEVALLLNKSDCTIYRMVQRRQIPFFRIAGSIEFDPSVLAAWLAKKDPGLAAAARQQLLAA
ncbi:MAG TPA: helix-turn-helix domain-containing protein [Terracidiphilus sp.]|jgi:excisionase family DNA binding protein|nr:helix-turn-helix domain-containing protein [Terracidiphilus sp.]